MNVAEAASRAGVGTGAVYQAIRRGRLLATPVPIKLGYRFDIDEADFIAWRAARTLTATRRRQITDLLLKPSKGRTTNATA